VLSFFLSTPPTPSSLSPPPSLPPFLSLSLFHTPTYTHTQKAPRTSAWIYTPRISMSVCTRTYVLKRESAVRRQKVMFRCTRLWCEIVSAIDHPDAGEFVNRLLSFRASSWAVCGLRTVFFVPMHPFVGRDRQDVLHLFWCAAFMFISIHVCGARSWVCVMCCIYVDVLHLCVYPYMFVRRDRECVKCAALMWVYCIYVSVLH